MELIFSKKFKKQAKKLVQNKLNLKERINKVLIDFSKNKRNSMYYRKKLQGKYVGNEELQVGGDIRIIVRINAEDTKTVLRFIGTHSQLDL